MKVWDELKDIRWKGKQVIEIRNLIAKGDINNLFALQDILLKENIFLTQDEIRYYILKLRSLLLNKVMEIDLICNTCKENMIEVEVKFEDLIYKNWDIGKSIEVDGKILTSKIPSRDIVIDRDLPSVMYNIHEMNACLEGCDVEWMLDLEMTKFKELEEFYKKTRFVFLPIVNATCICGKISKIMIDSLPNIINEW